MMKLLMIRLSLIEKMVTIGFYFVRKDYLTLTTLGLIERSLNGWIVIA